jgi:hypothetical protein
VVAEPFAGRAQGAARPGGQPAPPCRPLTGRPGVVELSLVTRDGAGEPLTDHFLRIGLAAAAC